MAKKSNAKANRSDGRYEIKRTIKGQYGKNGKPLVKSFYSYTSKADCEKQYQDYIAQTKVNYLLGANEVGGKPITLGEWAVKWLETYKHGKIKEASYLNDCQFPIERFIIPRFGDVPLSYISPANIESFIGELSKRVSLGTVKKIKANMNAIYETAIDNELCVKNPCRNVRITIKEKESSKRTYSQQMVDKILKFCDEHEQGLYIRILLENGLRVSELCGLTWADFDTENKSISIVRAVTDCKGKTVIDAPKSKSSKRVIPITSALAKRIEAASKGKSKDDFVVEKNVDSDISKALSPGAFRDYRFKRFLDDFEKTLSAEEAKAFKPLSPHEMRHTCGTLLYARTKDLYAVSKFLGHSSVEITAKIYVHESLELLRTNLKIE